MIHSRVKVTTTKIDSISLEPIDITKVTGVEALGFIGHILAQLGYNEDTRCDMVSWYQEELDCNGHCELLGTNEYEYLFEIIAA